MLWRYNIGDAEDLTNAADKLNMEANREANHYSSATNQRLATTNA